MPTRTKVVGGCCVGARMKAVGGCCIGARTKAVWMCDWVHNSVNLISFLLRAFQYFRMHNWVSV